MTKISIKAGHPLKQKTACLVLPVYEGKLKKPLFSELDASLYGRLQKIFRSREFSGKAGEVLLLHAVEGLACERFLLVGLGPKKTANGTALRNFGSLVTTYLAERSIGRCLIDTSGFQLARGSEMSGLSALSEGVLLAGYSFDDYREKVADAISPLQGVTLLIGTSRDKIAAETAVSDALVVCRGICCARDLVNQPGNTKSPLFLAEAAQKIAREQGLKCTLLDKVELEKQGFGALLGVAQGSLRDPYLIVLEYHGGTKDERPVALVGKGVVFDAGGISLKPSDKMDEMKMDMAGGAAVLGAIQAVAELKLPVNLVAVVPAVENLPSGSAYRPGDILRSLSGKTIEVMNTDAEGRLILADALTWVGKFNPRVVIDLATLTGACIVALGHHASAVLGNHEGLIRELIKAGERCGDRLWQLPLWDEYNAQIKGDFGDIKNTGGRPAGTITAAAFLKQFAEKYTWAHLDIAGTAWSDKGSPGEPKGGTGVGVRVLVEYLRGQC
ncbi:leucyl aminopeptidase [Geopsychrobacter electrodiphilus]|uniref:leucyl aminopeptidase n=1 Tax=Geopsychrobacter electrodiphilus TaxID=225196 RepID=UPI0003782E13|nr:leucyl aminopeptidase [Geopsychrobacter electrodiphilus]